MKTMPLSRGLYALIDDADHKWLSQWKWHAVRSGSHDYAGRWCQRKMILMHRVIVDTPPGLETDHINGNGLDNRRVNLRWATPTLNQKNGHRRKPTRLDLPRGVRRSGSKYWATIKKDKKDTYLGMFPTIKEASGVYLDEQKQEIGKEVARIAKEVQNG